MTKRIACLMALVVLVLTGSPASAADEIGLSPDGVTFTPELAQPLFDSAIRWVPGDSRSATFFVRNQGGSAARLAVDILGRVPSDLLDTGDISITATGGGTSLTPATDGGTHRLLSRDSLDDGQVVPITITIAFDEDSTNETQLLASTIDFRVTLNGIAAIDSNGAEGQLSDGNAALPDTGAPGLLGLAIFAALCLGAGGALISRRTDTEGAFHG